MPLIEAICRDDPPRSLHPPRKAKRREQWLQFQVLIFISQGKGAFLATVAKETVERLEFDMTPYLEQKVWLANLRKQILGTEDEFGNPVR